MTTKDGTLHTYVVCQLCNHAGTITLEGLHYCPACADKLVRTLGAELVRAKQNNAEMRKDYERRLEELRKAVGRADIDADSLGSVKVVTR